MSHIHTRPGQIDHTVTAYIVRTDGDESRVLLHMHKRLQHLLPVGGHIELDETPWMAAAHEIEEESGYHLDELMVLQPKERIEQCLGIVVHPLPFFANTHPITDSHYHSDVAYILTATAAPSKPLAVGESQDIRWLSRKEVVQIPAEDIAESTRQICVAILDDFLHAYEPIPASSYCVETSLS